MSGMFAIIRRFCKETRSDTALEFAMIGTAFFLFIFGIFVVSIDQFWQMTLDDAVRNAARQVQIGKITTASQFETAICNEFGVAAPFCGTTLQYSVQGGTSFSAITPATLTASGTLTGGTVVVGAGAAGAILPGVIPTISASSPSAPPPAVEGTPQFLLVQVAYPLPFLVIAVPNGVATENGTSSLFSNVATAMEP